MELFEINFKNSWKWYNFVTKEIVKIKTTCKGINFKLLSFLVVFDIDLSNDIIKHILELLN